MAAEHHPFDADRPLRVLCTCGQPHIVAEHIQTFGAAQEGAQRAAPLGETAPA